MRAWVKLGLFLSSYLPLFVIFTIKNSKNSTKIILFIILIYSIFVWSLLFWRARSSTRESFRVLKVYNKAKDALSYLIPYIISFMSFELNKWQDICSLLILLAIIFIVSVRSELIYINPVIYFLGFGVYEVEVFKLLEPGNINKLILITRREIKKDIDINVRDLEKNIVIEVD